MYRMANHNFKSYIRMRLFMPQVPSCTCLYKNQVAAMLKTITGSQRYSHYIMLKPEVW